MKGYVYALEELRSISLGHVGDQGPMAIEWSSRYDSQTQRLFGGVFIWVPYLEEYARFGETLHITMK